MTNLEQDWLSTLDRTVSAKVEQTGFDLSAWRIAGRPTKDKPHGEDIEFGTESGLAQLHGYSLWLASTDWTLVDFDGEPAVELPVSCHFGDIPVRGFIDGVWATPDGELVVVDYKTGSRTPDSLLQLGLYAASLEQMGYPRPSLGAFYMTRKGEMTKPESLDRYTAHFWEQMFSLFSRAVQEDIFLPNVAQNCRTCGVRDACAAVGGVDAYRYDPLHPAFTSLQDTN